MPPPLHHHEWIPPHPLGAIIALHGSESHAEWFEELAAALQPRQLALLAYDRPGWGQSPGPRGLLEHYDDALHHVTQLATHTRERFGSAHLAGLSWGGLLALYAALRRGPLFDSVTLIAPGLASRGTIGPVDMARLLYAFLRNKTDLPFTLPFRPEQFTRRADRQAYIRDDPWRVTRVSAGFLIETHKMRRFVAETVEARPVERLRCLLAGADTIVDNPRLCAILHPGIAEVRVIPDTAHSLIFEAPEAVADLIAEQVRDARDAARQRDTLWNDPPVHPTSTSHAITPPPPASDGTSTDGDGEEASGTVQPACFAALSSPSPCAVVLGAGGVGSAVGALMALGGRPVVLVARPAHAEAVERDGLDLVLDGGVRRIGRPLRAVVRPEDAPRNPALVIVAVKSYDTPAALDDLAGIVGPNTVLCSLQNGLGNEAWIARAFADHALIAGAIGAYVSFEGPGRVAWADDKGGLLGACAHGDADRAEAVWRHFLPATGMACRWIAPPRAAAGGAADVSHAFDRPFERAGEAFWTPSPAASVKWSKLLLNVGFNAANAITGWPVGRILRDPALGRRAAAALKETCRVMRRLGVEAIDPPGYRVRALMRVSRGPTEAVRRLMVLGMGREAGGASSMRQDLTRPRPSSTAAAGPRRTELDEINGEVVRAGQFVGVPTPANQAWIDAVDAFRREPPPSDP